MEDVKEKLIELSFIQPDVISGVLSECDDVTRRAWKDIIVKILEDMDWDEFSDVLDELGLIREDDVCSVASELGCCDYPY